MAPIGPSTTADRVVVHERRDVAELLAGGRLEGPAGELVDDELRAVARAVLAVRAWREAPDERMEALVRAQGVAISGRELEALRREGSLRRAA